MKRVLSLLLTAALTASLTVSSSSAADPAGYPDVPADHTAQEAIQRWSGHGLVVGDEKGNFDPDGALTRAAFATILDRVMGYQVQGKNTFSDMTEGAWYLDAVLRLNAAGVLEGAEGKAMPEGILTRQEAAVLTGRALGIDESDKALSFTDKAQVADWAEGFVSALAGRGCFAGESSFRPTQAMTRAETVVMLDTLISTFINADGEYSADAKGSVVVNAKDVTLKDMTVQGDLIVADGVADGDVHLEDVKVDGQLIIRGGGENSIHIAGDASRYGTIVITKTASGVVRVVGEDGIAIPTIHVADGSGGVVLEGMSVTNVVLACDAPLVLGGGLKIEEALSITAEKASVNVEEGVNVARLSVTEQAADTNVSVAKGAKVTELAVSAKANISNQGTIKNTQVDASGVELKGNSYGKLTVDKNVEKPTGEGAKDQTTGGNRNDSGGDSSVSVSSVPQVTLSLPAPKTGKLAENAYTTSAGYTVSTQWQVDGAAAELPENRYAVNTVYTAVLTVTLSNNYEWQKDTVIPVRLNGADMDAALVTQPVGNRGTLSLTYAFPATVPVSLTFSMQSDAETSVYMGYITEELSVLAHVENESGEKQRDYPVSYRWYEGGDDSTVLSETHKLRLDRSLALGTYYYYCSVSADGCAPILSHKFTVTVSTAADIPAVSNIRFVPAEENNSNWCPLLTWDGQTADNVNNYKYWVYAGDTLIREDSFPRSPTRLDKQVTEETVITKIVVAPKMVNSPDDPKAVAWEGTLTIHVGAPCDGYQAYYNQALDHPFWVIGLTPKAFSQVYLYQLEGGHPAGAPIRDIADAADRHGQIHTYYRNQADDVITDPSRSVGVQVWAWTDYTITSPTDIEVTVSGTPSAVPIQFTDASPL